AEQSNTAIVFDDTLFLKLFRRVESGINTDLEMTRFLNETSFTATPRVVGALEYQPDGEPMTLAALQMYTPNSGDAWTYTLGALARSSAAGARGGGERAEEWIGASLADAELLGRRTAQMHLALASRDDVPAFAPEPFTPHYQRSIYQSIRSQAVQTTALLRRRGKSIADAELLVSRDAELQQRIRAILDRKIDNLRIHTHGDYHLGQVLHTGNDFTIIDFEGEPARPLSERRIKRSALRDVTGMLRSFHYAPYAVVHRQSQGSVIRSEDLAALERGAQFWHRAV